MQEVETFTPEDNRRRRYWYLCAVGLLLIYISIWLFNYQATKILFLQDASYHEPWLTTLSRTISEKRTELQTQFLSLSEQKSLKESVLNLNQSTTSPRWRKGFLDAMNATCRSIATQDRSIKEFALRDTTGHKLAGLGKLEDLMEYYNVVQTIQSTLIKDSYRKEILEKWIIPIRDLHGDPIAFFTAVVNPIGSTKRFERLIGSNRGIQTCILDQTGNKVWAFGDLFSEGNETIKIDQFHDDYKDLFLFYKTNISDTDWLLCVAFPKGIVEEKIVSFRLKTIIFGILATIIMCVLTVRTMRQAVHKK